MQCYSSRKYPLIDTDYFSTHETENTIEGWNYYGTLNTTPPSRINIVGQECICSTQCIKWSRVPMQYMYCSDCTTTTTAAYLWDSNISFNLISSAPFISAMHLPSLYNLKVGIAWTSAMEAISSASSTSTETNSMEVYVSENFWKVGLINLQGPHQDAVKSTMLGTTEQHKGVGIQKHLDKTRQGKTMTILGQDRTREDKTRQDKRGRFKTRQDRTGQGKTRQRQRHDTTQQAGNREPDRA
jgi:hypothetical protein